MSAREDHEVTSQPGPREVWSFYTSLSIGQSPLLIEWRAKEPHVRIGGHSGSMLSNTALYQLYLALSQSVAWRFGEVCWEPPELSVADKKLLLTDRARLMMIGVLRSLLDELGFGPS